MSLNKRTQCAALLFMPPFFFNLPLEKTKLGKLMMLHHVNSEHCVTCIGTPPRM